MFKVLELCVDDGTYVKYMDEEDQKHHKEAEGEDLELLFFPEQEQS